MSKKGLTALMISSRVKPQIVIGSILQGKLKGWIKRPGPLMQPLNKQIPVVQVRSSP
jgi:hypothetical protein